MLVDPRSLEAVKLGINLELWVAVVIPSLGATSGKTRFARSILPREYSRDTIVYQLSCLARLIHSLYTGNLEELARSVSCDYLAEPYRHKLVPRYYELKDVALREGARGFNIAGAGPSVFLLHEEKEEATRIGYVVADKLREENYQVLVVVTRVAEKGAHILYIE